MKSFCCAVTMFNCSSYIYGCTLIILLIIVFCPTGIVEAYECMASTEFNLRVEHTPFHFSKIYNF